MKITIVGAGNMASALSKHWLPQGHEITLCYSRDSEKLARTAAALGAGSASPGEAKVGADVIVLAVPYDAVGSALAQLGPLQDQIVWSIVNPINADTSGLQVGTTTSGSELIAAQLPGARFVAGWPLLPKFSPRAIAAEGQTPTVFACGDDDDAKKPVVELLEQTGAAVVDAGPLQAARLIEPAMMLLVHLAYGLGIGQVALQLLRR